MAGGVERTHAQHERRRARDAGGGEGRARAAREHLAAAGEELVALDPRSSFEAPNATVTLFSATAVTRSAVGRVGGYGSPFGRTTTWRMFDQRELTLPAARTFQNQRPGSSTSCALAPRECSVCICDLKLRSRATRRS